VPHQVIILAATQESVHTLQFSGVFLIENLKHWNPYKCRKFSHHKLGSQICTKKIAI
jgi:hypothetical protein